MWPLLFVWLNSEAMGTLVCIVDLVLIAVEVATPRAEGAGKFRKTCTHTSGCRQVVFMLRAVSTSEKPNLCSGTWSCSTSALLGRIVQSRTA